MEVVSGACLKSLISDGHLKGGENRIISGNILTGKTVAANGYLGFFSTEVTVIPENHNPDFLGWILPGFDKFSLSRTFFSWLNPRKKYVLDTHMHGEERAFVMSGIYERVFPFDIYPVPLLKAILTRDVERMENLGIYEVIDEDFALCEVICPSKIDVQHIVREGLDYMREEVS
jgi:Na+-transporting NADH:ubiquinone oxidoreductase subunit A